MILQSSSVLSLDPSLRAALHGTHTVKESASHLVCAVVCAPSLSEALVLFASMDLCIHDGQVFVSLPLVDALSLLPSATLNLLDSTLPLEAQLLYIPPHRSSDWLLRFFRPRASRPLAADKLTIILRYFFTKSTCTEAWVSTLYSGS